MSHVLILARYFTPAYKAGGPVQSLEGLISSLKDHITFNVVCTNKDLGETQGYSNIPSGTWLKRESISVMYLEKMNARLLTTLLTGPLRTKAETIYLNSIFDLHFSILPLLLIKLLHNRHNLRIVCCPRGELFPPALRTKAIRKRIYLYVGKCIGLFNGIQWQATTPAEKLAITSAFPHATHVAIAPNISRFHLPERLSPETPKRRGHIRIVFLARICAIKNLAFAIEAVTNMSSTVTFDIIGPLEDTSYWEHCRRLLRQRPSNVTVSYRGALPHAKVLSTLTTYHAFLLPTKSENFGHSIIESLAAGVPVAISDRTPWRNLAHHSVGVDLPINDTKPFTAYLDELAALDNERFQEVRRQCQTFSRTALSTATNVAPYINLFHGIERTCRKASTMATHPA